MSQDTASDSNFIDDKTEAGVILPARLRAEVRTLRDPERRLRLAVLEDAIRYVQRYPHAPDQRGRTLHEDALDWISSPDRDEPFSFENICEALHLDAGYVRRRLRRWRDAERARVEGAPAVEAGAEAARRVVRSHRRAA